MFAVSFYLLVTGQFLVLVANCHLTTMNFQHCIILLQTVVVYLLCPAACGSHTQSRGHLDLSVNCMASVYLSVNCMTTVYLSVNCVTSVYLSVNYMTSVYLSVNCSILLPCFNRVKHRVCSEFSECLPVLPMFLLRFLDLVQLF